MIRLYNRFLQFFFFATTRLINILRKLLKIVSMHERAVIEVLVIWAIYIPNRANIKTNPGSFPRQTNHRVCTQKRWEKIPLTFFLNFFENTYNNFYLQIFSISGFVFSLTLVPFCKMCLKRFNVILLSVSLYPVNIRLNEDVFRFCLQKTSSRRLQDVLLKTNIFT